MQIIFIISVFITIFSLLSAISLLRNSKQSSQKVEKQKKTSIKELLKDLNQKLTILLMKNKNRARKN
ncbi:hypothetical protein [Oceanobacillus massiliensis]|uniref:hypothetical protein n=1 Tax=Oceanobacillus massiliensis TaxID=1465765 RepID=UPI0002880D0C|nr:hypothetical protein [Oceanobacillus massiliensis]